MVQLEPSMDDGTFRIWDRSLLSLLYFEVHTASHTGVYLDPRVTSTTVTIRGVKLFCGTRFEAPASRGRGFRRGCRGYVEGTSRGVEGRGGRGGSRVVESVITRGHVEGVEGSHRAVEGRGVEAQG